MLVAKAYSGWRGKPAREPATFMNESMTRDPGADCIAPAKSLIPYLDLADEPPEAGRI
jgi:hypothetical protein